MTPSVRTLVVRCKIFSVFCKSLVYIYSFQPDPRSEYMIIVAHQWAWSFMTCELIRPLVVRAASSLVQLVLQRLQTTPVAATLVGSVSTSEFIIE